MDDLFARSDFITVHVPLNDATRNLVNAARIQQLRRGSAVLNFSRGGIVDAAAVIAALDAGHLHAYCVRLPQQCAEGSSEGRDAAASGRLHQ